MDFNESHMKELGHNKVWSTIKSKDGNFKKVASTQIGQQMILSEAIKILPEVRDWVKNGSSKTYRLELHRLFKDDDILLERVTQCFLFLAGDVCSSQDGNKRSTKHKKVNSIRDNVLSELTFEVAWRFIEVIVDLSEYFYVENVAHFDKNTFLWSVRYRCTLSEGIIEKISLDAAEAFYPLPIVTPPIDWSWSKKDGIVGGYSSKQYEMIRAGGDVDYSKYSQEIFDSINYIQSIPWRVNEVVLNQVISDLEIPKKSDFVKTEYPDIDECKWSLDLKMEGLKMTEMEINELKEKRRKCSDKISLYNAEVGDYESAVGKYRAVKMASQIAEKYVGKTIYFPHSFDFRGRIYPISIGLSPQGSDAVKSMIEYDRGEVLNRDGAEQGFAYLASLYGDDKLPYGDRIERGMELLDAHYKDADEPYQFLAHQIDMREAVENPKVEFRGRIHLDACNSGSQFTSAITGDKAGCEATNVIPTINEDGTQTRKDAYLLVAEKALELTKLKILAEDDVEKREELVFIKCLLEKNGRKICKTPVMVSNYGGTAGGRAEILWHLMREFKVDRKWINRKTASNFGKIIGDSINGVLNGGKAFETYIHKMNGAITKKNNPIHWTTGDGFYVKHVKFKELKSKMVSCILPGSRKRTVIKRKLFSKNISITKMRSAISPNYIHSLDAELLRRVALRMQEEGIRDSDWIHDSFGCHPNHVDMMLDITKDEFLKLMGKFPLKKLNSELRDQMPTWKKKDLEVLSKIKIPQLRGFNIKKGGLDSVKKSNWFFS